MSDARRVAACGRLSAQWRMHITLVPAVICLLLGGLSCPSETVAPAPPTRESEGAPLVLFLTGNELGSLRPCGCSGGQLGGLEKRAAIFDRAPASRRLILETGNLAAGEGEQDLIKFRVLFEGLRLLDYDMVCLTAQDVATAERLGLLSNRQQTFDLLKDQGEGPKVLSKRFSDQGLSVNVASFDPQNASVEQVTQLFGGGGGDSAVNILILRSSDSGVLADLTAKAKGIDCVVCPTDVDEPRLLSEPGAKPVVVTAGRLGRHVCRLEVATPASGGRPTLRFEDVPVTADLPNDPALVQLYRQYQQLVGAANLLESYPRIPLPDGLSYAGSDSCMSCHQAEFDEWITEGHADALNSLKKVGSDRDPECVVCHVIGFEYEGGYITEEKTPQFKDVGCENCHGPGSEHNESLGLKPTRGPKTSCLACHTPEKSTGYSGHEEEYMQKIKHWREPAAAGNVKH